MTVNWRVIANELTAEFEANKTSRGDWEDAYANGLELLGFHYEERTQPFRGATGVTHPLLAEAATQFQAQAFNEMLPPGGPVRTVILGDLTDREGAAVSACAGVYELLHHQCDGGVHARI
jgi:hypothetical protein